MGHLLIQYSNSQHSNYNIQGRQVRMLKMSSRLEYISKAMKSVGPQVSLKLSAQSSSKYSSYLFSSIDKSAASSSQASGIGKEDKHSKNPFNAPKVIQSKLLITDKKTINHDSYIYRLKWAGPQFKLSIGQHFRIVQKIPTYQHPNGEEVVRKYTPISPCSQTQYLDLLVKIYRPNQHPLYPLGGKLTPYLQKLKVGDHINIDGPFGKFGYKSGGICIISGKEMKKKRIFFIAGGSGITPCYQTISQIIKMRNQPIQLVLLFGNKKQQDILLRKQLQRLQPKLKIFYTLDLPPEGWNQFRGYITKDMLQKVCPLNDPDTLYIHCGPRGMNQLIRNIFKNNYPNSTIFKY